MIVSLRGRIIEREADLEKASASVVVEVAGVGYELTVTPRTFGALSTDTDVLIHVHHHFWEADQKLFGFETRAERSAFEGLLAAHKVGPSLALAIIATHPPDDLARILDNDDLDALCEVPGVGKKTAQRLLVELKSSLVLPAIDGVATAGTNGGAPPVGPESDVREALRNLGYEPGEIKLAMSTLPPDIDQQLDSGAMLKLALRALAGG